MKLNVKELILTLFAVALAGAVFGQEVPAKADFILKAIDEVTWPADKATGTVVITVVGETPLKAALEKDAAKGTPGGKKIEVRFAAPTDDLTGSQVVVIGVKQLTDLAAVLKKLNGQPVLTVSDNGTFAGFGVMIDFLKDKPSNGAPVSYALNKMSMKESGLKPGENIVKMAAKTYG
ncbi:exported hypothetical protein [Candidatus Zixiibacteriota bacterium]|nr:exported hypothetical protein [candidate division Zixibacteria bacterium]